MTRRWTGATLASEMRDPSRPATPARTDLRLPLRWASGIRHRECADFDYARLRWYGEISTTYRLTADYVLPSILRPLARLTVEGLEHVPLAGPVILAANHPDNLDGYLLLHLVPRMVHIAARADAFGTGCLCAFWRRLGAFPADFWGMRHALRLLAGGGAVALFPQGTISNQLHTTSGAAGLLALHSGVPVVPIAISGTDAVHLSCMFGERASVHVRFGAPLTFTRGRGPPCSVATANAILHQIGGLLPETR